MESEPTEEGEAQVDAHGCLMQSWEQWWQQVRLPQICEYNAKHPEQMTRISNSLAAAESGKTFYGLCKFIRRGRQQFDKISF